MHTAMLWFDNSQDAFGAKIANAARYYEKKYGRKPNLCLIHPSMWGEEDAKVFSLGVITIRPYRPVLPGHIWIGIEDKE